MTAQAEEQENPQAIIDILLPTYNGEAFIREQLDSLLNQTFEAWHLYISDDGSSDGTKEIVQEYATKDPRIEVVLDKVTFGSSAHHFMALLSQSTSPYTMFCDQDDVWNKDKVALTLERMQCIERTVGTDTPIVVFTDAEVVDEQLSTIHPSFAQYTKRNPHRTSVSCLVVQNVIMGCTAMVNQSLRSMASLTPSDAFIIMHDWWLALLASAAGEVSYIDQATLRYRQHGKNQVGAAKYSIMGKLGCTNNAVAEARATIEQANSFYSVYNDLCEEEQNAAIKRYCSLLKHGRAGRLLIMGAEGTWKYGFLRKCAQVLTMIALPKADHEPRKR